MKPKKHKAVKIFFIIICLIFGLFFVKEKLDVNTSLDEYDSKYIYVENRTSKNEVIKKNHKVKTCPASLTKIMTTIVALEHIEDLSAIAPVDVDTYKEMVNNNSSMAGFYGKEQTTYRDLLYGTILSSGGEAANSLAINIAGSVENFVKLMNNKASELGLHDTHFVNPEGLHDKNQYTTAYDMAKLLDYALDNGHFRAIFTKETFNTTSTLDHPGGIVLRGSKGTFFLLPFGKEPGARAIWKVYLIKIRTKNVEARGRSFCFSFWQGARGQGYLEGIFDQNTDKKCILSFSLSC
jgi:D-alanyl-D-alanine carboxypeptidase (penicillin-binding protein 5/6)